MDECECQPLWRWLQQRWLVGGGWWRRNVFPTIDDIVLSAQHMCVRVCVCVCVCVGDGAQMRNTG